MEQRSDGMDMLDLMIRPAFFFYGHRELTWIFLLHSYGYGKASSGR